MISIGELVRRLQRAMNAKGSKLQEDGEFGPKTQAETEKFDIEIVVKEKPVVPKPEPKPLPVGVPHAENPAYVEGKKYEGKKETDSKFGAWLSGFWKGTGLPNYKTIIGTTFAWCGLFIFAMNTEVGQKAISGAAGAKNWAKYGVEIEYKKDGIPRGAVIHIDHDGDCKGDSNHVTFADGDCTPSEVNKAGATFNGFGGNQGNTAKVSSFPMAHICAVRWPSEVPKPGLITKSLGCTGKSGGNESTR